MIEHQDIDCLLCGSNHLTCDETLTGAQIRALWQACGIDLSPRAFGPVARDFAVNLYRCVSCGFRFYDPGLAGTAQFYQELMAVRAYPGVTPEFTYALDFASRNGLKRVLDVGGGEGHFLDLARKSGMDTAGVELNPNAAAAAAAKGHRMFSQPMEEITCEELDGGTDMLTLFQVVEHVASPVRFVADAARLVRAGGYLVIAVPSERRMLGLLHHDPANWPPHHVSRWCAEDLSRLARAAGLSLIHQAADRLTGRQILWACQFHDQLAAALGRRSLRGGEWLAPALTFIYRKLGCKYYLPCHGLSIHAIFRTPP